MFLAPHFRLAATHYGSQKTYDAYFDYNVLLINVSGEVQSTGNITFVDSSSNYALTPIGAVTQGSFTPFYPNQWSVYFDGSSYLSVPKSAELNFGTGSFTIECWINTTNTAYDTFARRIINIGGATDAPATTSLSIAFGTTGDDRVIVYSAGTALVSGATPVADGRWHHIAVTRSGSSMRLFVDGMQSGATTTLTTQTFTSGGTLSTFIGTYQYNKGRFEGSISNVRIIKGQALYTGAFIPPSAKLTVSAVGTSGANVANSITGTVALLALQDNRFIDNSTTPKQITVGATPRVEPTALFTNYSNLDCSVYLDGVGCITVPANTDFNFGTGDFTIECWVNTSVYSSDNAALRRILAFGPNSSSANLSLGFLDSAGTAPTAILGVYANTSVIAGNIVVADGLWHHVAVARVGTALKLFIDGVQSGNTATTSTNFGGGGTNTVTIGGYTTTSGRFNGYLSNLRIVKGQGLYSSAFTPPKNPYSMAEPTGGSIVSLFIFRDPTMTDYGTTPKTITRVGTGISYPSMTKTTPFREAKTYTLKSYSGYFDGTSYATIPGGSHFDFGTGDFTIECWVNINTGDYTTDNVYSRRIINFIAGGKSNFSNNPQLILFANNAASPFVTLWTSVEVIRGNISVANGNWHHVALARSGTNLKLFVDGVQSGSTATNNTTNFNAGDSNAVAIGAYSSTEGRFKGRISNLRIVKGAALYTAPFAVPTAALTTNIGNTGTVSLLTLQDDVFIDNSSASRVISNTGVVPSRSTPVNTVASADSAPITIAYSPAQHGGSLYFSGSNCIDIIENSSNKLSLANGNWTAECWLYKVANVASAGVFTSAANSSDWTNTSNSFVLAFDATDGSDLFFGYTISSGVTSQINLGTISTNTWTHIAVVKNGAFLFGYVDGVLVDSIELLNTQNFSCDGKASIGRLDGRSANYFKGYISDLRLIKGSALYPTNSTTENILPTTTGLQLWLDAAKADTMLSTNNVAGQPVSTDGSSVKYWKDRSANNRHFAISATNVVAPTLELDTRYGKSGVRFSNKGYLTCIAANSDFNFMHQSTAAFTLFAVISVGSGALLNNYFYTGGAGTTPGAYVALDNRTGTLGATYTFQTSIVNNATTNLLLQDAYDNAYTNGSTSIFACTCNLAGAANATAVYQYVNGSQISSELRGSYSASTSSPFMSAMIGRYMGTSVNDNYFGDFVLHEMLLYSRVLTDTERGDVTTYLDRKWNLYSSSAIAETEFTPPASLAQATANTSLLLRGSNGAIIDATGKNNITIASSAQVDTAVKRFGTGSLKFNGTSDYISVPETDAVILASGTPFTIEAWIYPTGNFTAKYRVIVGKRTDGQSNVSYQFYTEIGTGMLRFYTSGAAYGPSATQAQPVQTDIWQHVAAVYDGARLSLYQNGSRIYGPAGVSVTNVTNPTLQIGCAGSVSTITFQGYMDDVRITKGVARYTGATFTVPTSQLPLK